ncbi:MAG: peptidoglycan -binding protein [Pseudomonadota bacterium]
MALARRSGQRFTANAWPGFVDAMTALLLVLMFVLSIFMIVQFILSERITSQDLELEELGTQVQGLAEALGLEQRRNVDLEDQVAGLSAERDSQAALIATLNAQRDELESRVASFEEQVAGLLADRDRLTASLETTEGELARTLDEQEALQLALATARDEIDDAAEAARLAAARREALQALIADLRARNADTQQALTDATSELEEEEAARLAEAAAAEALRDRLENADAELTAMTLALEEQRREAEETLTLLAAAQTAQGDVEARLAEALAALETSQAAVADLDAQVADQRDANALRDELADALAARLAAQQQAETALSEAERNDILLRQAERELAESDEARLAAQREAEVLNQQILELRNQLSGLQNLLDEAENRDREAQIQLDSLGNRLNSALAQVAQEQRLRANLEEAERRRLEAEARQLERFRSEFFGQLREVLGDREGVEIVGDRFVFSSEVLFDTGEVSLQPEGRAQITQVAAVILDVADQIPPDIDWILRVDGHTDDIPVSGRGRYRDNWELSQGRALSVVQYMIDVLGVPPERLAATGFGQYRPVDPSPTPEARQRNRRIELKLTER